MTLAEKITAARAALVATKDALTALATKENPDASDIAQMDELSGTAEKQTTDLAVLERAEKALGAGARPVPGTEVAVQQQQQQSGALQTRGAGNLRPGAPGLALRGNIGRKGSIDLLVRSALAAFEAYVTHESVDSIIARRWPGSLEVAETSKLMAYGVVGKAATAPAMTTVQGWAAELVREGYGAFMDALAPESIVPRIPMQSYQFDGYGKIIIPSRLNGYPTDPNLAAAFRAEGDPIRVSRTTLTTKYLTPKSMGVIGPFTRELLQRSTPNIEEAIRAWMLEDTALALDVTFLDAVAGTAIRPAGIRNGVAAGDTRASSGNTPQNITDDIMAMLTGLSNHNMGRRPVWIMNQARAWGLAFSRTPTGDAAFPGMETGSGTLAGIPVIASTTVPADVILLVDAGELAFAGGPPVLEGSTEATLHMEDGAPNTDMVTGATVLPINNGTPAVPVRSLYQTNSAAIKATWEIDWAVMRPGAVQVLTGVAWGTPATP